MVLQTRVAVVSLPCNRLVSLVIFPIAMAAKVPKLTSSNNNCRGALNLHERHPFVCFVGPITNLTPAYSLQ